MRGEDASVVGRNAYGKCLFLGRVVASDFEQGLIGHSRPNGNPNEHGGS